MKPGDWDYEPPPRKKMRKYGGRYRFYSPIPEDESAIIRKETELMDRNDPVNEFNRMRHDLLQETAVQLGRNANMVRANEIFPENRFTRQLYDFQQNQPPMYKEAPRLLTKQTTRNGQTKTKPYLAYKVNEDTRGLTPLYTEGLHVYNMQQMMDERPIYMDAAGNILRVAEDKPYSGNYNYAYRSADMQMPPPKGKSLREFLPSAYGAHTEVVHGPIIENVQKFLMPTTKNNMLFDRHMDGTTFPPENIRVAHF